MGVELLQTLSLVAYILAGLFFVASLILFFYLKVPALWGEVTGRTARKAIQAMKWNNEDPSPKPIPTGISKGATSGLSAKLAEAAQAQAEELSHDLPDPKERTPLVAAEPKPPLKVAPVEEPVKESVDPAPVTLDKPSTDNEAALPPAEEVADLPIPSETAELPIVGVTGDLPIAGETAPLPSAFRNETSILPTAEVGQTSVLPSAGVGETDLLPHSDIGQTAVLSPAAYTDFVLRSTGELPPMDETTILEQRQDQQNAKHAVFFVIEKELAFTDSTEIIE